MRIKLLLAGILIKLASRLMDKHLFYLCAGKQNTNYAIYCYHLGYALIYASRCFLFGKGDTR